MAAATCAAGAAWANPVDRGIDFQQPATPAMTEIVAFHNFVLPIIIAISVFVLALLLWVMIRYNRRANPTPRKFTHNMLVEVIWTIVPVLILVAIAWRSFPILYQQERAPVQAEFTIKAIGNSWFWQYEYQGMNVNVVSNRLPDEDAAAQGRPRLLAVDNPIYVPVGVPIRMLITSNDVIHSWMIPAFGIKQDAIPGRVNEGWFQVDRPGIYYGQCSELCGVNHAFMPIEVRAVPREEFERWVASQGGTLAQADPEAAPAATTPATAPAEEGAARADQPAR
ncbi:MAG: cytochrome c oxidase subunit II [Hyphomonadaceae bacterium]